MDLDDVLREIRNSLLLHPVRSGAVKVVIELDTGEQVTVLDIGARCPQPTAPAPPLRHRPVPPTEAATSSVRGDDDPVDDHSANWEQQHAQQGLLQRCNQQQQRIAELEERLQQVQLELHQHEGLHSSPSADRGPPSPAPSTDDDSISVSSSSHTPHRSSGGDTDEDSDGLHKDTIAMADADDTTSSSSSSPPASNDSTAVRRSKRSKAHVERWSPPTQQEVSRRIAEPTSSRKKRRTGRRQQSHHDDGQRSICSDTECMEVDSVDSHNGDDGADNGDDAVEVAALVAKLRDGYDRRHSIALDALSKETILSLHQQVLDEAGDRAASLCGQITSLISTSTSLKMAGYFLRAILTHRLKFTSQNSYKRLARETLGVKSPADIAAYPALYELVQHHYPTLASAGIEVWLENPIFSTDITWTEWKRYLTKSGRPVIDAALQQFKASVAPFQDWMALGWVEVYDDDTLGQGVRALRDIHMPMSQAKEAQRDVAASISVVAADLHCAGPECVLDRDAAREADPMYLVQLDKRRVFDARHHWIGKINHLPDRLCNLKLTGAGKLVQTREIAAGEVVAFDYGVDYWVYQLSGLELSEWCAGSSVACSRGTQDLFRRMHDSVLDYTGLFSCDWVRCRPAVWSELERESWMGNLAEFVEDESRKQARVM